MTEPTANSSSGYAGLSKKHLQIAGAVLVLFLLLGYLGFRWALNDALAVLAKFEGDADRDTAAEMEKWFDATEGDDFYEGDGARTATGAKAHFRLGSGAQLTLKPSSQIRFQRSAKGSSGGIGIQVEVGEADVKTNAGMLSMDSEFGPIEISPNSTVSLRREKDGNMKVDVELGSIKLGEGADQQEIAAGKTIELEIGGVIVDIGELKTGEEEKPVEKEAPAEEEEEEEDLGLDVGDGVSGVDLVVTAGDKFTVHDPSPPTAIGFKFGGACDGPGRLIVGKQKTEAKSQGNLAFGRGYYRYEVRCLDAPNKAAVKGTFRILRDAGTRQLPTFTPSASVTTDGRRFTVMYQTKLPRVTVTWPSAPKASSYTLKAGGRTVKTSSPSYTFPSGALRAGTHRLVFSAASDPPRQSRTTTVAIVYDTQAPAARVSTRNGFEPGSSVNVSGQALPGWSVSVDGEELEVDSQRRFSSEYQGDGALPIAFSHPTHGMHYYLRRPRPSQ